MAHMTRKVVEQGSPPHSDGPRSAQNNGLVRINCFLRGKTPLLMNAMTQEQLLKIRDKEKAPKTAAKPSLEDEARGKLHLLADGTPHIPTRALLASFIEAGK